MVVATCSMNWKKNVIVFRFLYYLTGTRIAHSSNGKGDVNINARKWYIFENVTAQLHNLNFFLAILRELREFCNTCTL